MLTNYQFLVRRFRLKSAPGKILLAVLFCIVFSGCATTPGNIDPYENFNRKIYAFNTTFDDHIAEPVANAYTTVTPGFMQTGVSNFFRNLSNVNVILNDFLQGKLKQGFSDTGRLAINSTIGILGLFDVAKRIGLDQHDEDFGQTLAVWGVNSGPYLVLPFVGPYTLRGTPSIAVDAITNPLLTTYPPLLGLNAINARARADGALRFIDEAALDPYVFTRESFLQWRNYLIHDGNPPVSEDFDDLEDELLEADISDEESAYSNDEIGPNLEYESEKPAIAVDGIIKAR